MADTASSTRNPELIAAEIEQTRRQLGETVAALAEKTDVKAHARQRLEQTRERARAKAPVIAIAAGGAAVAAVAVALVIRRRD
jgi:hypothetical protein